MRKKSVFKDHIRQAARAAADAFSRKYNSEMAEDEADAPDAVAPRFRNDYGDKYKGMAALPDNIADPAMQVYDSRPNPKAYPVPGPRREAYLDEDEDEAYLAERGWKMGEDEVGRVVLRHAKLPGHRITVHADETFHHTDEDEAVVRKGHVSELKRYAKSLVGRAAESFFHRYHRALRD